MLSMHSFWGKTPSNGISQRHGYKPVLHHLIDVSATALCLQRGNEKRLRREADNLGVGPDQLAVATAFLAGLHDLGKFSVSFQAKVPELWPAAALGAYPGAVADRGHWRNTAVMLRARETERLLKTLFPGLEDGLEIVAASVAGHHGQPPSVEEYACNRNLVALDREITAPCLAAALDAMHTLRNLTGVEPLPEITDMEQVQAMSWRLAGLTTLADWIGSDAVCFPFEDPATNAADYWQRALPRADKAILDKGIAPAPVCDKINLATLVPGIAPRPMQSVADAMEMPDGPGLFLVEDTTGSGKTEAALTLAARLMAAGRAEGLYFALPTMATANAMYGRLGTVLPRLFENAGQASLVLAHGQARLSPDFLRSVSNAMNGPNDRDATAVSCAEWIADNRRKAFFADIGAGTIDQAFLAVLKKKHLVLRQYGLAGRVLIVDEAHAFDAYMGQELETLLSVHASLGASAIILSATLPAERRLSLVKAFRRGLGLASDDELESDGYPLLTVAGKAGVVEQPVVFCDDLRRTVGIERLAETGSAHERAVAAARNGAAVLVIRNAVDEAISSFEALSALHPATELFHARFAMCDRQAIEKTVLARFGRDADPDRRRGRILVATQVVEQSLDLDFDLVISDLAPVDLLIQRVGRLWRHMDPRPENQRPVAGPTLCVISPDTAEATCADWLEPVLGRGAFVYDHPGVMWRTARTIFDAGAIRVPDDLRAFIERVYEEDDVPECLRRGQERAEGEGFGARALARRNLISFADGYPAIGAPSADQEVGTRLSEETVTLRLARLDGGRVVPWARNNSGDGPRSREHGDDEMERWALSEVTVRRAWLKDYRPPDVLTATIHAATARWPDWEREAVPVGVVDERGRVLLKADESIAYLTYNAEIGVTWSTPPARG